MNAKLLIALSIAAVVLSNPAFAGRIDDDDDDVGAVYTMTNAPDENQIVIFDRDSRGVLKKAGMVSTHGKGSGGGLDPLGSQGSIMLSKDQRWLLAANAGSHEISVLRVLPDDLEFTDKAGIGNLVPVSVAIFHDLVYVLGTGPSSSIIGFKLTHSGHLKPLSDSTRVLGAGAFAQVSVDPRGENLVISDKAGKRIVVYALERNGRPVPNAVVSVSSGNTPFGLSFDRHDHLLAVEAGSNAVSSYQIRPNSSLQAISRSVPNGQQASCWIATNGRRYLFTANPGTQSISSYRIESDTGAISLLAGVAATGNKPLDLATTENGHFLYALDPGSASIDAFQIERDGSLTNLGPVAGSFSVFAQGIAVR